MCCCCNVVEWFSIQSTSFHTIFTSFKDLLKKGSEPCTALTRRGPTRETPSRLESQQVSCYRPCLPTRLFFKIRRMWNISHCPWTDMACERHLHFYVQETSRTYCSVTKEGIKEETVPFRKAWFVCCYH